LQSYDQLLNNKYQVKVNQKSVDRVKNYFKWSLIEASRTSSFDIEAKKIKLYTRQKK
jgi:hypothetical protein